MTLRVEWHPEAEAEFDADIGWYDDREAGLGDRFELEVLTAVDEAVDSPGAWPMWLGWTQLPAVRSKAVDDFPYRVAYFVEDDLLTILAVAHSSRQPGYWHHRVVM